MSALLFTVPFVIRGGKMVATVTRAHVSVCVSSGGDIWNPSVLFACRRVQKFKEIIVFYRLFVFHFTGPTAFILQNGGIGEGGRNRRGD